MTQTYSGIGQISYDGNSSSTSEPLSINQEQLKYSQIVDIEAEGAASLDFTEVLYKIVDLTPFDVESDYYYRFKIRPNSSISNIDVILTDDIQETTGYQYLKRFSIEGRQGGKLCDVAFVKDADSNGVAAVYLFSKSEPELNTVGAYLYYDSSVNKYVVYGTEIQYDLNAVEIKQVLLDQNFEDEMLPSRTIEGIFRPAKEGFNRLWLRLERTPEDYHLLDENLNYVGRTINVEEAKIFKLKDIIKTQIRNINQLDKIGVWGTPGLKMGINGEEIRIGSSGYYELDVLPVTSLSFGIVDNTDVFNDFTVDYLYNDNSREDISDEEINDETVEDENINNETADDEVVGGENNE